MAILEEFKQFLLRGNVIELAVAVVIGVAFGAVVNSLVKDILTPIVAAIFGKPDFASLTFSINDSTFRYGSFLNAVLSFVLIAAAIFFVVVKPYNVYLERRRRLDGEPPASKTDEVLVLEEIRDLMRSQGAR
jgi:large conductance mechanosensitive channel